MNTSPVCSAPLLQPAESEGTSFSAPGIGAEPLATTSKNIGGWERPAGAERGEGGGR
jgi:hypothetical protein